MSVIHWHRCDGCNGLDAAHPDDGAPAGWYLVARMSANGCWDDENEYHFCSADCLNEFTWGDDAPTVHHEALSHEAFPGCCEQGVAG